jgi:hypothetical protein
MMPAMPNMVSMSNKAANNSFMPAGLNKPVNAIANAVSNSANFFKGANSSNAASTSSGSTALIWIVGLLVIFLAIFAFYYDAFMRSIQNWIDSINMWFKGPSHPPSPPPPPPIVKPIPPQDENERHPTGIERVVEKILPPAKEVFTISKNDYSFYDAAPLCKALGAQLATYDEVKNAWQRGADWCNYGWVKGQMAVYPTQTSTYEELQEGPADQRGACGKPGVNGGYFDNPELKFGVTCSGKRPPQSSHDATSATSGSLQPLTVSGLEFDKKVQQFKAESDTMGILPFNKEKWSS